MNFKKYNEMELALLASIANLTTEEMGDIAMEKGDISFASMEDYNSVPSYLTKPNAVRHAIRRKDTFHKKEERKELLKQFQDWDKNGDGVLSRDEIIDGYRKTYGSVDENEIDNMIHIIDLDGNGVIDYNEFLNCAINKEKIVSNERLEIAFKTFDSDGSGKICVDEIMDIFTKGAKNKEGINKEVFEKMVKGADENGDGEISFTEFKAIMKEFSININIYSKCIYVHRNR